MSPRNAAAAKGKPEGLGRADRIRKRRDYLRVQSEGRRVTTRHFVLLTRPAAQPRVGVTVTKRVAGAVGRNRVKRLVREVYRRNRRLFPAGCEVVFIARRGAHTLRYADVEHEVARVRRQLADGRGTPSRHGSRP